MKTLIVIPARLGPCRFSNKLLKYAIYRVRSEFIPNNLYVYLKIFTKQ